MAKQIKSTWLIKQNGILNAHVDKDLKLVTEDSPVAVVSVIGAQSGGKSSLCNYLFGTEFKVMDAQKGRFQTTKGNWVAKKPLPQGCLLVIDTEGQDGSEKKDDNKFEKQTALFALAVSDIIVMNMWCIDVGRYQAAGWPLLMTVFEAMMRICDQRKATLLFVLRDKTQVQTPLEVLKKQIMEELLKMWKELIKPQDKQYAKLKDYFQIEVVGMPSLILQKKEFSVEAAALKERIVSLSKSRNGRIAASGFADYAKAIWDLIRDDKDLDLPRQRTIVAEIKCNQIAKDNYTKFCENESWGQLKKRVYSKGTVKGFGKTVNSLIQNCLSRYDRKTSRFDEMVRNDRRNKLMDELLEVVEPIHQSLVEHMCHVALKNFKKSIDLEKEFIEHGEEDLPEVLKAHIYTMLNEIDSHFADASILHATWDHPAKLHFCIVQANDYVKNEQDKLVVKLQKGDSKLLWKMAGSKVKIAGQNVKNRVSTFFKRYYSFISMWLEQKVKAAGSAIHSGVTKLYLMSLEKYSAKRINQH